MPEAKDSLLLAQNVPSRTFFELKMPKISE